LGSILPNQLLAAHDPSIVFNFKAVKADGIPTEPFIDKMHLNVRKHYTIKHFGLVIYGK
jgi:hypothetical protein